MKLVSGQPIRMVQPITPISPASITTQNAPTTQVCPATLLARAGARPDHVYAHIGMGEALMKMDESQKALEHLLAASRLDPLNATVHYRLSVLYREMGRGPDAHRELAAFEELQEAKKRIQHVDQQMHELVPEKDALPPDAPKEE